MKCKKYHGESETGAIFSIFNTQPMKCYQMKHNVVGLESILRHLIYHVCERCFRFQVAFYNYMALKDFFKGFPEFSSNDFYVTGESYAGVYVPTLSELVMEDPAFNFKVQKYIKQEFC